MNELNALKNKIQSWLDGLNPRERHLVMGGGAFLIVFILYQLTWAPFTSGVADMQIKLNKQQQDLIWMQQSAQEVRSLQGGKGGRRTVHTGSLLGLIEKTARQGGLGSSIRKVQPEGQNGVRVWLDKVSFDAVMTWLDELQVKQGVMVSSFTAEQVPEPGRVNIRMLVEVQ
ncbi:MAG: type II secretion system protein M [Gammaproteobacteria bacterium]|nr:type II secretion system protein M [Gammaproteobacteria bacterium]